MARAMDTTGFTLPVIEDEDTLVPTSFSGREAEVRMTYGRWVEAVVGGDPDAVLDLYADDAVLMATFSPGPRETRQKLREYFTHFTALPKLSAATRESIVRVYDDLAIHDGLYTFAYEKDGVRVEVPARFSFVYRKRGGRWMIAGHHSSQVPPSIA